MDIIFNYQLSVRSGPELRFLKSEKIRIRNLEKSELEISRSGGDKLKKFTRVVSNEYIEFINLKVEKRDSIVSHFIIFEE